MSNELLKELIESIKESNLSQEIRDNLIADLSS